MASPSGPPTDSLTARLAAVPFEFDFFQAVRKIECAWPSRPRIGYGVRAGDAPVRFCQPPSLSFAPSSLAAFEIRPEPLAPLMYVHFMGLLGPNGPLPLHMTQFARERLRNQGDPTLSRFLDIFHHRMIALFYRAWACNQQTVSQDRPADDRFGVYIGSLFGIGMSSLRNRDAVSDLAKLHYSGRLVCQTRHAEGLQAVLSDYFRISTEVQEFIGRWMDLPEDCRCRLGESPSTGLLGSTAIVGSRIWECQQSFRLRMGPMGLADYLRMLPRGTSLGRLVAWVKNYIGDELLYDVQLVLKAAEVPSTRLGAQGMLGWTTWLSSRPFSKDADDLVLRPLASGA